MDIISLFSAILHDLPGHLTLWSQQLGPWLYVLLFAIVFAETGLIVTPFLPGDSLLFAVGALAALPGGPDIWIVAMSLIVAAIAGDAVNYGVGRWFGAKVFVHRESRFLNPQHLVRSQEFYVRHGGKTILLARFLPIIRTYAPFVAGLSQMRYATFALYNVAGAVAWILLFLLAGHQFGNIPSVQTNFHYVIGAILVVSALPAVIEVIRARRNREGLGESKS